MNPAITRTASLTAALTLLTGCLPKGREADAGRQKTSVDTLAISPLSVRNVLEIEVPAKITGISAPLKIGPAHLGTSHAVVSGRIIEMTDPYSLTKARIILDCRGLHRWTQRHEATQDSEITLIGNLAGMGIVRDTGEKLPVLVHWRIPEVESPKLGN